MTKNKNLTSQSIRDTTIHFSLNHDAGSNEQLNTTMTTETNLIGQNQSLYEPQPESSPTKDNPSPLSEYLFTDSLSIWNNNTYIEENSDQPKAMPYQSNQNPTDMKSSMKHSNATVQNIQKGAMENRWYHNVSHVDYILQKDPLISNNRRVNKSHSNVSLTNDTQNDANQLKFSEESQNMSLNVDKQSTTKGNTPRSETDIAVGKNIFHKG